MMIIIIIMFAVVIIIIIALWDFSFRLFVFGFDLLWLSPPSYFITIKL